MTIKIASPTQIENILNYALAASTEATVGYMEANEEKAKQLTYSFLENGGHYLVYTTNNQIRGWIGLGMTYEMYRDKWIGLIYELYVLPSFRKQGIASQLCHAAEEYLRHQSHDEVYLNVFAGNHAKHMYEKLGYEDVSTMMKKKL